MKEHITKLRVRYAETDQMGIVYYANYFIWFEVARVEFLRRAGIAYKQLEHDGMYLIVTKAACHYRAPALYDDTIIVKTTVADYKNTSFNFVYKVQNSSGKILAEGETAHVFVNKRRKPVKIPDNIKNIIFS
ncbi:MAG: thioesterase family protein [Candidatus Omnitrophota bacterium]